jgi:hypothetical protein
LKNGNYTAKGMATRLKRQPTEWEKNIGQGDSNQNLQRINDPMKKWANELNRAISKEEALPLIVSISHHLWP